VLANLRNKEAVLASISEPVYYTPVPPQTLLSRLKRLYVERIDELEERLVEVQPIPKVDLAWNLGSRETLLEKITTAIENSRTSLLISIWPEEVVELARALRDAEARGVSVVAGIFGVCEAAPAHSMDMQICGISSHRRLGKHLTVIVADDREVVIGEMDAGEGVGIWSTTPAIVLVAKEYIKHDMWGCAMLQAMGEEHFSQLIEQNELLNTLIKSR
jgi:sugar-specific transcriptional regulator TrmB